MKAQYPKPSAIAQTIAHRGTSLQGARRLYAANGTVVYAYDRQGMANAVRRTWLQPSSTRRLSTYLDMATSSVGGLTMQPAGVQLPQLDFGTPTTAVGRLRELAEVAEHKPMGRNNRTLCWLGRSDDPAWDWSGILRYDHSYRLRSGEYTTSRPAVTFHVRADPTSPTRANVLVEIRRPTDYRQVHHWLAALLPLEERWAVLPLTFLSGPERHGEIRSVVDEIGCGSEVMVAHGVTERPRAPLARTPDLGEFERSMQESHYKTSMHGLDALIKRAEEIDFAVVTAFDLYHWHGAESTRVAVRVGVKQHGHNPLTIEFGSVREPRTQGGTPLATPIRISAWERMTSSDWSEDQRMAHLRRVWTALIGAQRRAAAVAAA